MVNITYFAEKKQTGPAHSQNGKFPHSGSPILTFRGVVYPWHLDHMDHMNVQHYVGMFDQSSWVLLAMLGLDGHYFREHNHGMAALEQTINYKSELRSGDMLEIRSSVLEVREKTMRIQHEMCKSKTGALAASTNILAVYLDTEARKSAILPETVRERARQMIGVQRHN